MTSNQRAHVVFAHPKLSFGGGERVLIEQVAALADLPIDISILFRQDPEQRDIEAEIRDRNPHIRTIRHAPTRRACLWWLFWNRPDLAVVCYHAPFFLAMQKWRRIGGSTRLMPVIHENYPSQISYHRRFAPMVDTWMLDYDWSQNLLTHFPGRPVHVANPLYPRAHWPSWGATEQGTARRALGIPQDALVIGYVGRMDINKEPWYVLRIAEELQNRCDKEVHVLLAGREVPNVTARLDTSIPASPLVNRIHRLGRVADVSNAFHALDLFVLASWQEGFFPLSIIEAMERGVPVLTSSIGGIPTVLQEGQGGFFIRKPDDQHSLTEAQLLDAVDRIAPVLFDPPQWEVQRHLAAERVRNLIDGYDAGTPFREAVLRTLKGSLSA